MNHFIWETAFSYASMPLHERLNLSLHDFYMFLQMLLKSPRGIK